MITRDEGELAMECDICETTDYGGTLEFRDFIDDQKRRGWVIRKVNGDWTHVCAKHSGLRASGQGAT